MKTNETHGVSGRAALASFLTLAFSSLAAQGASILPTDTQGLSTSYTTGDGLVTLYAYAATGPETAGSFNTGGFLGVSDVGNVNAVNDGDGDIATTADQEALDIQLSATVGLSEIIFQWSRAEGAAATDGIRISGFTSDPGVTVGAAGGAFVDVRWDGSTSSVYAELSGAEFNATQRILQFADLSASAGQTLRLIATDSNEGGSQAAITSISYDVVPEPGALALLALGGLALLRRRR